VRRTVPGDPLARHREYLSHPPAQQSFPGFGPGLGAKFAGFLSNPLLEQIFVWQVLQQISSTILGPEMVGLQQEIFKVNSSLQLSIADAVEAVIKSHMTEAEGESEASLSGLKADRFKLLIASAGEPPGLDFLTEAWRRKLIPQAGAGADSVSLEQGIRESRLKNKWIPTIEAMQFRLPDPSVVIEGWLRAQITDAQALDYLQQSGIPEAVGRLWYASSGRPPGPGELIDLYRRGVIPLDDNNPAGTSLRQGYLETDLKNKWYGPWLELARYVPPPRTVTAMVREGSMSDARAVAFYKDAGLDQATATEYLNAAHHQRVAAAKETSRATWLALYRDGLATVAQVTAGLEAEGYAAETVAYELEVVDFVKEAAYVNKALAKLGALYVAHKLDKTAAAASLATLGLDQAAIDHQLTYWDQERQNNVAILTAAQIGELVKLGWLSFESGANLLQGHGYSVADSELYLIAHLKLAPGDPSLPATLTVAPS
jgi:hypothetical protein